MLKATSCPVSDSFDLLLCNPATPSLIQLAGVAASGMRSDTTVADLGFDLLQPDHLNTSLTVQVGAVGDVEGDAISASAQNGQVRSPCDPESESCPTNSVVFIPLVQR